MPLFGFRTKHGRDVFEGDPIVLATLREAWKEATRSEAEILKDIDGSLEPIPSGGRNKRRGTGASVCE
jgi:hypothetical protein